MCEDAWRCKASIQMDLKTKMVMSIIVPCLNEEEVLPLFIRLWKLLLPDLETEIEYVFVDDGSSDGTLELLKGLSGAKSGSSLYFFLSKFWQRSSPLCRLTICDRRSSGGDGCRSPGSS